MFKPRITWKYFFPVLILFITFSCGPKKKKNPCKNPIFVSAMKEQAVSLFNNQDYIQALKTIEDAAACNPDDPEVYYWLGRIYMAKDKSYAAIEAFEKAISIDETHMESRMALGVTLLGLERWDGAIEQFERISVDDYFYRQHETYNNLGWAYLKKGEYVLAELNLKKALKLSSHYCQAHCNLGELYAKQNDSRRAIAKYNKTIEYCPDNFARPYFLLGVEYGKANYPDYACQAFVAASRIKNQPEAEQAMDYLRLYQCPGVVIPPPE